MAEVSDVHEVEVVVAHGERATLRLGGTFLKVDGDAAQLARELRAMELAPVPTADVLWHQPNVVALAGLRGAPLGRLDTGSTASPGAWRAVGAAVRALHDAPLPPWPARRTRDEYAAHLTAECDWLVAHDVLPADVVERNRRLATSVLRDHTAAFVHGDLQVDHVFVDGDVLVGVLDWSEAAPGDPLFDLATLTLGCPNRLDDLVAGYGADVDRELVRGWWSMRCLGNVRWLMEHGFGPPEAYPEVAVLRSPG